LEFEYIVAVTSAITVKLSGSAREKEIRFYGAAELLDDEMIARVWKVRGKRKCAGWVKVGDS
jgi:hypothetical protein